MKKRITSKNGFTLVEVIVVLVILAILAAVLVPTYVHYIRKSHEKTCKINRSQIERYYDLYLTADNKREEAFDQADFEKYVSENYGDLESQCPSGGLYTVREITSSGDSRRTIKVACSVHTEKTTEQNLQELQKALDALIADSFRNILSQTAGFNINSEAPTGSKDTPYAVEINKRLQQVGIDTAASSWRLYNLGNNNYNLFWCDSKIKIEDKDKIVSVTRYNKKTGKYATGTAKVRVKDDGNGEYAYLQPNEDFE